MLSVKVRNNFYFKQVDKFLKSILEGLKVKTEICRVTSRGWVQIAVSGEDEKAALRYLAGEVGLCPTSTEDVEKFSMIKGYIIDIDKSKDKLQVDIGVSSPKIIDATISLQHLQAQLIDGRKAALKKIAQLFGFCKNLPLTIKISGVDEENDYIEAMLSEKQLIQYRNWTKSLLDRLIIVGTSAYDLRLTLKRTGLNRDIVKIEPLGLFEQAIVCHLGTDAVGLIPKIGRSLPDATFSVFNPKRVLEFLNYATAFTF